MDWSWVAVRELQYSNPGVPLHILIPTGFCSHFLKSWYNQMLKGRPPFEKKFQVERRLSLVSLRTASVSVKGEAHRQRQPPEDTDPARQREQSTSDD